MSGFPLNKNSHSLSNYWLPWGLQLWVGHYEHFFSHISMPTCVAFSGQLYNCILRVRGWNILIRSRRCSYSIFPGSLGLKIFLLCLPWCSLSLGYEYYVIDSQLIIRHCKIPYSLHLANCAFSLIISVYCRQTDFDQVWELHLYVCIVITI